MTDPTDAKQALLSTIDAEHVAWRVLIAEIGDDRMSEPGPMGEWTFRDLVVHLLGWRERTIARLEAIGAGRPDPPDPWPADLEEDDEVDAVNDWIQAAGADRSVRDVLDAADASYDRLRAALGAIPSAALTDPAAIPWLDGAAATDVDWLSHLHDEHEPSIRAWLASRG